MKICDVTQFYSPVSGGVRRYLHAKREWLSANRPDDEHLLIVPGERTECRDEPQVRTHTIRSPLLSSRSQYRALLDAGTLRRIIEQEKPDVIECGDPYQIAWQLLSIGSSLDIPVVGFYHSHLPELHRMVASEALGRTAGRAAWNLSQLYVRTLYRRFARTIVPNARLEGLLQSWGVGNTSLVRLGVDTKVFHSADPVAQFRGKHGIPKHSILLLHMGRLAPEKNLPTLFAAFEKLHRETPGRFHLLAVGDGPGREKLLQLRQRTDSVTWLPWCDDSEKLVEYYRSADLLIHPGVQETFGLVALESQACGTPVIGIRGSALDDIVFHNQNRWASENTPQALAEAIAAISPSDLRALGKTANERVAQECGWDGVFQRLHAVYESLIADRSSPSHPAHCAPCGRASRKDRVLAGS